MCNLDELFSGQKHELLEGNISALDVAINE
jgi:hypothetical protein